MLMFMQTFQTEENSALAGLGTEKHSNLIASTRTFFNTFEISTTYVVTWITITNWL